MTSRPGPWSRILTAPNALHALIQFCRDATAQEGHRPPYLIDGEPTAENIAKLLLGVSQRLLEGSGVRVLSVRVFETPNCSATAEVSS